MDITKLNNLIKLGQGFVTELETLTVKESLIIEKAMTKEWATSHNLMITNMIDRINTFTKELEKLDFNRE